MTNDKEKAIRHSTFAAAPAADEVHVWAVRLDVPDDSLLEFANLLSAEERERAKCFARDDLLRRFVVAHAAVRTILGRYLAVEPREVPFEYGPHGKPRLREGSRGQGRGSRARHVSGSRLSTLDSQLLPLTSLRFNLAHSGELAVVALAHGGEIGVDVERLRTVRRPEQLAERYFAPDETAAILAAPKGDRSAAFLALWTAKEAILKATGRGLSYPLASFSVSPSARRQWVRLDAGCSIPAAAGPPAEWHVERIDVPSGYLAAVATNAKKHLCPTLRYPDILA